MNHSRRVNGPQLRQSVLQIGLHAIMCFVGSPVNRNCFLRSFFARRTHMHEFRASIQFTRSSIDVIDAEIESTENRAFRDTHRLAIRRFNIVVAASV